MSKTTHDVSSLKTDQVGLSPTGLKPKYQDAADSATVTTDQTKSECKVGLNPLLAVLQSHNNATVNSVTLNPEEKSRGKKADEDRERRERKSLAEKSANKLVGLVKVYDNARTEVEAAFQPLKKKIQDNPDYRDWLRNIQTFFAHRLRGKRADGTPIELLFDKYASPEDFAKAETNRTWDHISRCIGDTGRQLKSGEKILTVTAGGSGGGLTADEKSARDMKSLINAAEKLVNNRSKLPETTKLILGETFAPAKTVTVKPIEIADGADGDTVTAKASHAIPVRAVTAFIADVYGGTRVSLRDVDMSLLTTPVLSRIFGEFLKLVDKLADGDQILRSFDYDINQILNKRKTTQASNPTEETVAA